MHLMKMTERCALNMQFILNTMKKLIEFGSRNYMVQPNSSYRYKCRDVSTPVVWCVKYFNGRFALSPTQ